MLDIVIPTLNEEQFLGNLLESLTKQSYTDFHVFVSDGNSKDNTVAIANSFTDRLSLTVVTDHKKGVSHQRNLGARKGKAPYILFLDADVVLHPNFLQTFLKEIKGRELANCWTTPLSKKPVDKLLMQLYNVLALEIGKYVWPMGMGNNLYSTRKMFTTIGGFDEQMTFWEDVDYIQRAIKAGAHYAILRKPKIYISTRRFEVEGRINMMLEILKGLTYVARTGKIPTEEHMSYPMNLDYAVLLKKKHYSPKQLQNLVREYKKYLRIWKKLRLLTMRKYLHMTTVKKFLLFLRRNTIERYID